MNGVFKCVTCANFQPLPATRDVKTAGECRINPPVVFVFPSQGLDGKMAILPVSFWPTVDGATQWCGKYHDKAANN